MYMSISCEMQAVAVANFVILSTSAKQITLSLLIEGHLLSLSQW